MIWCCELSIVVVPYKSCHTCQFAGGPSQVVEHALSCPIPVVSQLLGHLILDWDIAQKNLEVTQADMKELF